jgi:hypothetical protein
MRINTAGLLALDAAVHDTAEIYNISVYAAAFRLMNDIQDYNKIGGLKKQLDTLCAQLYTVKEVCSNLYQAMVALLKLKSYGITEHDILNLNNYLEINKINLKSLAAV